ncbi:MAG TPA: PAS domain S-box protein [Phototrophicaceae bacterium]|nr:PAS domain S-box protein [Phototrophicaceae bacterium]
MRHFLSRWLSFLTLPTFDETTFDAAHFLTRFAAGPLVISLIIAAILLLIDPAQTSRAAFFTLGGLSFLLIFYLSKHGKVRSASRILILMMWLFTTLAALTLGGIRAAMVGYYMLVITAPFLLGARVGIFISLLVVFTGGVMTGLETQTTWLPTYHPPTAAAAWVMYSFGALVMTLVVNFFANAFVQSVQRARHAEAQWRGLVQNSPDIIFEVDQDYRVRMVNRVPVGWGTGDIIGQRFDELALPEYRAAIRQALEQAAQTLKPSHVGYYPETSPIWYSILISPIVQNGQMQSFILNARDVTASRQAEESLRASEAKFRQIVESVPVGLHIYQLESDGKLIFGGGNRMADTILHTSHEALVGKSFEEAFPMLTGLPLVDIYKRVAATGEPWQTDEFTYESRHKHILEITAFQTAPGRIVTTFQDITARKLAEEVLTRSEANFRALAEHSPAGVFTLDDAFKFIYANPELCQITEYPHEKMIGLDFRTLFTETDRGWMTERYLRRQRGEEPPQRYEVDIITGQGQKKRLEISVAAAVDADGRMRSMGQVVDLSPRVQAEQRRLELALEKEKLELMRSFVSNMTHDLKTPLANIQTSLYLLERYTDPQKRQEKLNLIRDQAKLLDHLIQDVLTISRLEYLPELELEATNVNDIVQQVEAELHPGAEKKQLQVEIQLDPELRLVNADADSLARAITNLLENAINYTPEGRTITIRTQQKADAVVIAVSDMGIGISPADLPQIFNRFYRTLAARETVRGGSGLGLAIVKRVIDMHKGQVEVESVVGQGSTFRLLLPLKTPVSTVNGRC